MWPSVDHSLLSPSGHTSQRAKRAADERTRRELFGDGLAYPQPPVRPVSACGMSRPQLERGIDDMAGFVANGYGPRKHWRTLVYYIDELLSLEQEA